jgi:small subunit ribosomal protein S5
MKEIRKLLKASAKIDASDLALEERLVAIDRVAKVVKGGKRMNFRALVVVGDGNGHVGAGLDKAREVPEAIRKAGVAARKTIVEIARREGTIPHEVLAKFGASKVLLKPAPAGTGVLAAGGVRAVLEVTGIKDVVSKSLGSTNHVNVVKATILALTSLRQPSEVVAQRKGQPATPEAANG